jgi:ABC-type Fe3+ transport system permease subunit
MDTTEYDLKLLSIGYFIQGGVATFYSLIVLCYVGVMGFVFTSMLKTAPSDARNQLPPGLLPIIGVVFAAVVLAGLAGGLCLLYSGYALRKHKSRIFVLVVAALSCMAFPYGTVLGIFTFMVLQRPAAKDMFGQTPAQPPPLPPIRQS